MSFFNLGKKPKEEEKPASLSLEDVQGLINEAIAKKEQSDNKLTSEQKQSISNYSKNLGKECLAQECFDKELSYSESLEYIIKEMEAYAKVLEKQFNNFNPDADNSDVGDEEIEEKEVVEPKTPGEAINLIVERDGCKRKQAKAIAEKEFPSVFKNWKGAR